MRRFEETTAAHEDAAILGWQVWFEGDTTDHDTVLPDGLPVNVPPVQRPIPLVLGGLADPAV